MSSSNTCLESDDALLFTQEHIFPREKSVRPSLNAVNLPLSHTKPELRSDFHHVYKRRHCRVVYDTSKHSKFLCRLFSLPEFRHLHELVAFCCERRQ